jgi:hypothetical protein
MEDLGSLTQKGLTRGNLCSVYYLLPPIFDVFLTF